MKGVRNTLEQAHCWVCDEIDPSEFNFTIKQRGFLRAKCRRCENIGRLASKRKKLKGSKNLISTHGGSSRSPQKVVPSK